MVAKNVFTSRMSFYGSHAVSAAERSLTALKRQVNGVVVLPMNRARKEHVERWERPAGSVLAGLLQIKGYVNLARRFWRSVDEVDIVVRRVRTFVVVKVKARSDPHACRASD